MEVIIFFLAYSLLWVIGFPIIAYPYYNKLKKEYNCPTGLFAFAIFFGSTAFRNSVHRLCDFCYRMVLIELLLLYRCCFYPFCVIYGLYLFYKSFTQNGKSKAVRYLIAIWGALILLALSSFIILNLYRRHIFIKALILL